MRILWGAWGGGGGDLSHAQDSLLFSLLPPVSPSFQYPVKCAWARCAVLAQAGVAKGTACALPSQGSQCPLFCCCQPHCGHHWGVLDGVVEEALQPPGHLSGGGLGLRAGQVLTHGHAWHYKGTSPRASGCLLPEDGPGRGDPCGP